MAQIKLCHHKNIKNKNVFYHITLSSNIFTVLFLLAKFKSSAHFSRSCTIWCHPTYSNLSCIFSICISPCNQASSPLSPNVGLIGAHGLKFCVIPVWKAYFSLLYLSRCSPDPDPSRPDSNFSFLFKPFLIS